MDAAAALIPIKAFHEAKARLQHALDPDQRHRLARWTAEQVFAATTGLQLVVVCDDDTVATWAQERGAMVLWQAGKGLNSAVDDAVAALAELGYDHVVVAHADLPRPSPLRNVMVAGAISLVPDRRDDGTNVMSFPTHSPVNASYGPGSFHRHLAAAIQSGLPYEVHRDALLALDIDTPTDLRHPLVRPLVDRVLRAAGPNPTVEEVPPTWLQTNPDNPIPHR